jgi:hypothetical protein
LFVLLILVELLTITMTDCHVISMSDIFMTRTNVPTMKQVNMAALALANERKCSFIKDDTMTRIRQIYPPTGHQGLLTNLISSRCNMSFL